MMGKSGVDWTDYSWSPMSGCTWISPGCDHCYARSMATRFAGGKGFPRGFDVTLFPERLDQPLRWRKPGRVFVCPTGDLFHDDVPDEFIDQVFGIMAVCPQHTFQVLSKRPERMLAYMTKPETPYHVARAIDAQRVLDQTIGLPEDIKPIEGYPGYFVSNHGVVYSSNGSGTCPFCGGEVVGIAKRRYCSEKCKNNTEFYRRTGRPSIAAKHAPTLKAMSPDDGEQGHLRVMLYRDKEPRRELVHRLVLSAFVRHPLSGEQGCHLDGNPRNNALPNLRWGDQGENWQDRKRQGRHRSYSKLTECQASQLRDEHYAGKPVSALAADFGISDTQVRNIISGRQWSAGAAVDWPLRNCWAGVTAENQEMWLRRVPILRQIPAVVHYVSYEPAVGPLGDVDLTDIEWLIAGGESGPNARPSHPDWFRGLRDACKAAGTAFYFKQHGEWVSTRKSAVPDGRRVVTMHGDPMVRIGKRLAGHMLDGREHREFPEVKGDG